MNRQAEMKRYLAWICGAFLSITAGISATFAQAFSSGSDGSYGPLNITTDTTLPMPTNGVFNCTTITVATGKTLTFARNPLNTPVYLLATGDVNIVGTIDVSGSQGNSVIGGQGGPGGFDGGSPGSVGVPPGAGHGPGAGLPGTGDNTLSGAGGASFGDYFGYGRSTNVGQVYGNALLIPMIGGSGGGGTIGSPGGGGGGGGGAILIASSTSIKISGLVRAAYGYSQGGAYNFGSGGAVRLVAPKVAGNGSVDVRGYSSGDGRIRIDATDRTQLGISFQPAGTTSVGSLMQVFVSPLPHLDILQAAGTTIASGSGPVSIILPFGSSPNQTVTVQAGNFNATVPLTLVLTPDHGTPLVYTNSVDNTGANNPVSVTFNVTVPLNEQTAVNVYSK